MNVLGESRMAMVLTEQADGMIKGSFRTTRDDTDVSAIAKALGGGGHKKAAGFTVPGPLASAFENIFQVMQTVEITN
jgi:phosphoesterase RecJ-like protein